MDALARFSRPRTVVVLSIVAGVTLGARRAEATDVQACLSASEKGQRARAEGNLREARAQLQICSSESCPAIVRRDCSQWHADITSVMPSVVFGAKDKQGRDLFEVTVSMDGEVLQRKLDGKSVFVDPGPHTFTFQMAGQPLAVERVLVKEGEKARAVNVSFGPAPAPAAPAAPPPPREDPPPPPPAAAEHSVIPWVVVGVGAAAAITGVVIVLTSPKRPSNCDATKKECTPAPGESADALANDQDRAEQADTRPVLGGVVLASGLVVVGGGLLWHFLEPTGPKATGLRVSPWAGPGTTGATLGGSF